MKDGWFTPSQFAGHLVTDQIEEKIAFFQMRVPEGVLNFDVNWQTTEEGWEPCMIITDVGFCPQMELRAGIEPDVQNLEFIEAITEEEAAHRLILCFYKIAANSLGIAGRSVEDGSGATEADPCHFN